MKRFCGVVGVLLMIVSVGVGVGVGQAAGEAGRSFPARSIVRHSDDGWTVKLSMSGERIDSVPALSRGHGSYEAFLDLRGAAEISGKGRAPVDAAVLTTGFQVSCQWQMDGVNVGITGGPTAQMSISYPPAVVLGVQAMPNISTTLHNGASQDVKFGQKVLRGPSAGTRLEGSGSRSPGASVPDLQCARTRGSR